MVSMKILDGRFIKVHICDTCGQICENNDYMGDDDNTMCPRCFNNWWKKVSQPLKRSETGSDKLNVSVDTASV